MWRFAITGLLAVPLAACQTGKPSEGVIGAYQRTETVRYNKRDYTVSFIYSDSSKSYNVKVRRPGGPMNSGATDRNNATQVASSTVSYYACPTGYRAKPTGAASFASAQWSVSTRCAKTG
ncbi:MAG: hypothetical protein HKN05_13825 [Rhizobiales bacterium]|nr:hypothetical protein [Hyphomicrobiales bacterium]